MTVCIYRRDPENVGDQMSCPASYFHLPDVERIDIRRALHPRHSEKLGEARCIILGGGGVFFFDAVCETLFQKYGAKLICWGVGTNTHGAEKAVYPTSLAQARLLGLRDDCTAFVPCASCMHPAWDQPDSATRPVVVYEHRSYPILRGRAWERLSNRAPFSEVVQFLSSGAVIVTNSYHGAYWGLLLDRKVIVYQPFSSKFYHFKWKPIVAQTEDELDSALEKKTEQPLGALFQARSANQEFYERVVRLLDHPL